MYHRKTHILSLCAVFTLLALNGCYTQFARMDRKIPDRVDFVVDSTGDTVKVIRQVDTIVNQDREICVWERDLAGYPRLRCFRSHYTRDWHFYQSLPWWYRNDPYWYDHDRCPPYYYYDFRTGTCRYIGTGSPPARGGTAPGQDAPSEPPRPRERTPGLEGARPLPDTVIEQTGSSQAAPETVPLNPNASSPAPVLPNEPSEQQRVITPLERSTRPPAQQPGSSGSASPDTLRQAPRNRSNPRSFK